MVQGRKVNALSSENYEGQLKARDHSITNLRRTLAEATGDSDESFRFEDDDYDIKLTQDEVVKTIFPVHVTVVHAKTGQTVIDQMFSVPKYVDLHYLSIAAHKRLRQVARQYRTDAQREAWIAAIGETVATMVRENRARMRGATDEEELVRKFLKFDPWLIAPGARSSDAIHRLQKHMPCHCNANAIWYSDTKLMMLVWDLEILEGLGLPPKSADIAIFNVKQYLPVRWIASNPKAYRDCDMPTEATFAKIDMTKDLLLCDVFSIVLDADKHVRESWDREAANPRSAARMTKVIFEIARAHHSKFQTQYDQYTLEFDEKLFVECANSFRHHLTGGMRPTSQQTAMGQRRELLRLNLTHVFHEIYCNLKENFPPLPSFPKILTEQTELMRRRLDTTMTDPEDVDMDEV